MSNKVYLSHLINQKTPLYGGRTEAFNVYKTSSIDDGKTANDTRMESTVHIGTHVDMPYHFYANGQTIEDFSVDFWFFDNPLYVEVEPSGYLIHDELTGVLESLEQKDCDILIVKTSIGQFRGEDKFWKENYGFSASLYDYLQARFPSLRVFGFDSISISSWQDRDAGKEAHKVFLNPKKPILLLEDMNLADLSKNVKLKEVILSPLRIERCDGLPCSVVGVLDGK